MANTRPSLVPSHSFKRMLELERQYMLDRLDTNQPSLLPKPSTPHKLASGRSSIQVRHAEFRSDPATGFSNEKFAAARRTIPLAINTSAARTRRQSAVDQYREAPSMDDTPTVVASPVDTQSPKLIAFEFPAKDADQRSICVSPSWESQSRRKKERKLLEKRQREEKREKERQVVAKAAENRAKKRMSRLTKPAPAPKPTEACSMPPGGRPDPRSAAGSRGRQEARASSSLGFTTANKPEAPPKKSRSRSSSFASMIRAPFERRRASVGPSAEPEFIGGIKLEFQRHIENEMAVNDRASTAEASTQAAAQTEQSRRRWSAPLKSSPLPPSRGTEVKDRHYPPITRYGSKGQQNPSLTPPTAPAIPDVSKVDRWRVRVGLKPNAKASEEMAKVVRVKEGGAEMEAGEGGGDPQMSATRHQNDAVGATIPASPKDSLAPRQNWSTVVSGRPVATQANHVEVPPARPPMQKAMEMLEGEGVSSNCLTLCNADSRSVTSNGYRTAPSSPPPEPPQRSPKRNRRDSPQGSPRQLRCAEKTDVSPASGSSDADSPRRAAEKQVSTSSDAQSTASLTPKASGNLITPNTAPALRLMDAMQSRSPRQVESVRNLRQVAASSSEESGSEEFHSPSPPSTPATSRSQSEKGPHPVANDKSFSLERAMPETIPEMEKFSESTAEDSDTFGVQAAADRALATFTRASAGRQALDGGGELASTAGQNPKPLRIRKRSGLPQMDRSSEAKASQSRAVPAGPRTPGPPSRPLSATYLEEARKLVPAAPPSRAPKKRLGPPASFILPGDGPASTVCSEASASTETITMSSTSTRHGGAAGREPVAKFFVECCGCKFYHDMPSNLYEAMANPKAVLSHRDTMGYGGSISIQFKCPWCKHAMSTNCCAGLAAMVYVTERLH
ncbi:hypothetical protein DCS_05186 [Drechmeria coniospora]|uniref:Uncharacterized protein n=1 Tax=Drechmeria coniospora TaxID=98403 RepID=A0A151GM37_DRECN|nr:hypothetical protein DCS_05186 [Drechmeria coniospora]KYK58173.1 hypothetical protein DCS_05186 [Drechmeria coniospora]